MKLFIINMKKNLLLIFILGALYMVLEGLWRGWTNISMLPVGGLCGFLVGKMSERFVGSPLWIKCLGGTALILMVEFISGMLLNVYLNWGIWDYSGMWGNIYGQICLAYAALWFILVPGVIYVYNYLKYFIFQDQRPEMFWDHYRRLFLGR